MATILNMGVEIRYNSPVKSLKTLGYAGRIRCGICRHRRAARQGIGPAGAGRHRPSIHIGIDWLESVAFGHIDKIGAERVSDIGVGNTAMDCCRSSTRMGGKDVKVMARRPTRRFFKASPWELDDAEEEKASTLSLIMPPKRFVVENGVLKGMEFD